MGNCLSRLHLLRTSKLLLTCWQNVWSPRGVVGIWRRHIICAGTVLPWEQSARQQLTASSAFLEDEESENGGLCVNLLAAEPPQWPHRHGDLCLINQSKLLILSSFLNCSIGWTKVKEKTEDYSQAVWNCNALYGLQKSLWTLMDWFLFIIIFPSSLENSREIYSDLT